MEPANQNEPVNTDFSKDKLNIHTELAEKLLPKESLSFVEFCNYQLPTIHWQLVIHKAEPMLLLRTPKYCQP
jgi:hypothetical protein